MRPDRPRLRSLAKRYGAAVALVGVGFIMRSIGYPLGREAPFFAMLLPALIATGYGGLGPGVLAAVLSSALVTFHFLLPMAGGRWSAALFLRAMVFVLESIGAVALVESVRSSRRRTERLARRIRSSYEVSAALGRTRTAHEASEVVLGAIAETLKADGASIFIASEPGLLRHMVYRPGPYLMMLAPYYREVALDGVTAIAHAARTRTAVFIETEEQWRERFPEAYERIPEDAQVAAALFAPMVVRDRLVGVLVAGFGKVRRFSEDDRLWSQALAQDCGKALDRARLLEMEQREHAEAQEASRARDEFLSVVSRELRAPLDSITAWIEALRKNPGDHALGDRGIRVIGVSVQAQERLVDGLLDLSRVVERRLKGETKRQELLVLVRSSVDPLQVEAANEGVELALGSRAEATIIANADRLRQAFRDFVSHAIQSTPPGGHVRVDTAVCERRAVVRVVDDGNGIEPDALPHALEMDGRGKNGERRPTGLAIARFVVLAHKGTVRVESPGKGRGTTLTVELPIDEPEAYAVEHDGHRAREVSRGVVF
jgi:signal transduction histidine kinase